MKLSERFGSDYNKLLESSAAAYGSAERLNAALSKETPVIAYLGGSVTYGYSSNGMIEESYPVTISRRLGAKALNYSISGTSSLMTLVLAQTYLHKEKPDIVFVEFAVNEGLSAEGAESFECLLRKLISLESRPAIIVVNVFNKDFYTCDEFMTELCVCYGLTCISIARALIPAIKSGIAEWSDYSADEVHPNADGHRFISDCILHSFNYISSRGKICENIVNTSAVFGTRYENLQIIDLCEKNYETEAMLTDWDFLCFGRHLEACGKRLVIKTDAEFSGLFVIFAQNSSENMADAEVFIDGEKVFTLNGMSIFGWDNPVLKKVWNGASGKHSIRISLVQGDEKKRFVLAAIGYYL